MSHFDSAITPVAGVGAKTRRQSGCLGGTQAQLETAEIPKQRCKDDSENSLEDVACSCQSQAGPSNVFMMVVMLGTGMVPCWS